MKRTLLHFTLKCSYPVNVFYIDEDRSPWRVFRCVNDSIMANIFYCCGSSNPLGTLRAVIQLSDLGGVLYEAFPQLTDVEVREFLRKADEFRTSPTSDHGMRVA